MAEVPAWMRQSMKKSGQSAPSVSHPKLAQKPGPSMHSKIATPSHPCGGQVMQGYADGGLVRGYADGGLVEDDKQAGLEASRSDRVGLMERLRMGNIDEPGSEAYDRFGAGMGRSVREAARGADGPVSPASDTPAARSMASMGDDEAADRSPARMTAAEFQRMDKETSPSVPAPRKTAARKVAPPPPRAAAPAPKASAPSASDSRGRGFGSQPRPESARSSSLSQSLGQRFAQADRALKSASPGTSDYDTKKRARDEALAAYEKAARAEKSGRSVMKPDS